MSPISGWVSKMFAAVRPHAAAKIATCAALMPLCGASFVHEQETVRARLYNFRDPYSSIRAALFETALSRLHGS